jgi:hypothetical protein
VSFRDILDLSPDRLMARLINVGLRSARSVGVGLGLVNELRQEYPDVAQDTIGHAVQTIGSGITAANIHSVGDPSSPVDLDVMPVLPSAFFSGGEPSRVAAFADVKFDAFDSNNPDQPPQERDWDVRVDCSEASTFQELIDCIEQQFDTYKENGPDITLNDYTNVQISIYFMGKRF